MLLARSARPLAPEPNSHCNRGHPFCRSRRPDRSRCTFRRMAGPASPLPGFSGVLSLQSTAQAGGARGVLPLPWGGSPPVHQRAGGVTAARSGFLDVGPALSSGRPLPDFCTEGPGRAPGEAHEVRPLAWALGPVGICHRSSHRTAQGLWEWGYELGGGKWLHQAGLGPGSRAQHPALSLTGVSFGSHTPL